MNNGNPLFQQNLDLTKIILITQELLNDLITSQGCQCKSIFNSPEIPAISLEDYMKRIHKYTQYSPECLVIAIVYIDRYNMAQPQFSLNQYNVHRVLLTCIMLAVKFHNDIYYNNITFEKAGGVNAKQLFKFELEIFQKLDFSVFVTQQQYQIFFEKINSVYSENEQSEETKIE